MPIKAAQKKLETVNLTGVQVLSVGTWNGDDYGEDDLDSMVECFNAGNAGIDPPVKLGHTSNQKLLQENGLPAAGYVSTLYRTGTKLYADIRDMPKRIADLVNAKAYSKVSSEVFFNYKEPGGKKRWSRVFKGLALLGADVPAVSSIDDIEALYGADLPELQAHYGGANEVDGEAHTYEISADMSYEQLQERLRKALRDRFPTTDAYGPWISETYSDRCIFGDQGGKYWQVNYSLTSDGAVTIGDGQTEVIRESVWRSLSHNEEIRQLTARIDHLRGPQPTPSPKEDTTMKELLKLLGLAEDADEATAIAKFREIQAAKPPEGQYSVEDFRTLQNQVGELSSQLAARSASTAVEDAIRKGKVVPAMKDWATTYATKDPEGFKAYAESQPAFVLGSTGSDGDVPAEVALTEADRYAIKTLGVDEAKFIEQKKELAGRH